jgi:hypothetical protein
MAQAFSIPGGPSKGTSLESANARDIAFWQDRISTGLEKDPNKQYADKDRAWLAAAKAELDRRAAGGAPAAAPRRDTPASGTPVARTAIQRRPTTDVAAGYRDSAAASGALQEAAAMGHLVSPATVVGELPAGTVLAISQVVVGVDEETYGLPGGKRGLAKVALDKISAAAGVSWDPERSGRLDDGRDPHYCHFRAVGHYRSFDGAQQTISGEVELDARDGGPLHQEITEKAARANRNDGGASQLLELRKFLLRHAESKARNRAIRSLGLRTSYTPEELSKPFLVAKVMFTGHSEDPVTRAAFAAATADAFLGSRRALYPAPAQLPARRAGHAPPPIGASRDRWDDDAYDTSGVDAGPDPDELAAADAAGGY